MSTIVTAQDVLASAGSSPTEDAPSPKEKAPPSTAGEQRSHSPQGSFQSEWTGQPIWHAQHSLQWPPKRRRRGGRAQGPLHPGRTDHSAAAEPPAQQGNLNLEMPNHRDLRRCIQWR